MNEDKEIRVVIYGGAGHGSVVHDILQYYDQYNVVGYADDCKTQSAHKLTHLDWMRGILMGTLSQKYKAGEFDAVALAIGNNGHRRRIALKLSQAHIPVVSLVHPSATISKTAKIGAGTVVCANAFIGAHADIGQACIINTGAQVDHHCTLGNLVHASPNCVVGGETVIGHLTWLCIGSVITNNIKIGNEVIVGAGSTVLSNVKNKMLVVGTPAYEKSPNKTVYDENTYYPGLEVWRE